MPIPELFTSPVAQVNPLKFGPAKWNAVTALLTGLLDGPDADGLLLSRDAASATGASWVVPPSVDLSAYVLTNDARLSDARAPLAHVHAFADLMSKPTSLAGYGILDAIVLTGDARLSDARVPLAHTQAFSTLTGLPSTLAGYGIPAVTKADVGLGAVENTALSTWAGSANLTTLGILAGNLGLRTAPNVLGANVDSTVLSIAGTGSASNRNGRLELINPKTPAAVGDEAGRLTFVNSLNGTGSAADSTSAYLLATLVGAGGANGFGGALGFWTKVNNTATAVERLRLDDAGLTLASDVLLTRSAAQTLLLTSHLLFPDNTWDIGASAATRPRRIYIGTQLICPSATFSGIVDANAFRMAAGGNLEFIGRGYLNAPANATWALHNTGDTAGVGLDFATDAILKVRTKALSAYGTVDCLGLKASGVAGVSFGPGHPSSITIVNGIVTACS